MGLAEIFRKESSNLSIHINSLEIKKIYIRFVYKKNYTPKLTHPYPLL